MSANLMSLARSGGKFLKLFGDRKMMKLLPYDAEIEFLESTGTQWIDTGVNGYLDFDYDIKFLIPTPVSPNYYNSFFGAWDSIEDNLRQYLFTNSSAQSFYCGNNRSNQIYIRSCPQNEIAQFRKYGNTLQLNKIKKTVAYSEPYELDRTLFLFGTNRKTTIDRALSGTRIYSFELSLGSETILDFIPARVGTVGYMYDRVSGRLFGNAGTGSFVIGPDKTI